MSGGKPRLLSALELVQHELVGLRHGLPDIQPIAREEILVRTVQARASQVVLHPRLVARRKGPDGEPRVPQLLPRLLHAGPRLERLVALGAHLGVLLAEELPGPGDAHLAQHAEEERPEDGEEGLVAAREVEEGELALRALHPREAEDLGADAVRAEAVADAGVQDVEEGLVPDACPDDVEDDVLAAARHGYCGWNV